MLRPRSSLAVLAAFSVISAACAKEASQDAAPAPDSVAPAATVALLDPNTASRDDLIKLPSMDSATVAILIAARPYADMTVVDRTLSAKLTEPQRMALYERLWKPLDLNKATAAEIKLIPGAGDKMAREFDEYRPYDNIIKFRRNIGKYVDSATVARFEKYVEIRP